MNWRREVGDKASTLFLGSTACVLSHAMAATGCGAGRTDYRNTINVFVMLCVVAGTLVVSGCSIRIWPDPDETLISLCETSIKSQLKSPTTYMRVSAIVSGAEGLPVSEIKAYGAALKQSDIVNEIIKRRNMFSKPYYSVHVEYDAKNGFGVPIRSNDICWLGTTSNNEYARKNHLVRIIIDTSQIKQLSNFGSS